MKISDIIIGQRHRRDMGDIDALAASIAAVGLLHLPVVNGNGELVAGGRRLAAVKQLGWTDVPVTVADNLNDAAAALTAERDENTCREPLKPSEMVALGKQLEALERPKAEAREKAGKKVPDEPCPNFGEGSEKGKTAEKVAAAVGTSAETYRKAKAVVEAAEADPELRPVAEEMDATGKVDPAYRKVKAAKAADAEPEPEADPCEEFVGAINRICRGIDSLKQDVQRIAATPVYGQQIHVESVTYQIESVRSALWQSRPTEVCNCVKGGTPNAKCKACYGSGKCPAKRVLKGGR